MRVAIISDIHSNLTALEAVLEDAEGRGVDDFWCLGDIVGYGPDPCECLAIVRERAGLCLSGNHDLGAIGKLDLEDFNSYAAAANRWTGEVLAQEEKLFLEGLPTRLDRQDVTLAHGSPRDPVWEYVLSIPAALASFEHFEAPLCLVGHSHMPFISAEPGPGALCDLFRFPEDTGVKIGEGRFIANPGSVGQPRDGDPRASYLVYDVEDAALHRHRVAYDIKATQKRMRRAGLPGYLIDRLSRGH